MDALLLPGLLLLAAAAGGAAVWFERRRYLALLARTAELGWTYVGRDDAQADRPGDPFGRGQRRRADDVVVGEHRGRRVTAFAYSYTTSTTDANGSRRTTTHRYAVAAVALPTFVPCVELTPAGFFARALGLGVELESDDFNRRYRLEGDPRLCHDVLPPTTVALLLDRPPVALRLLGAEAVTWVQGRLDLDDLLPRLDTVCDVLDGVPDWVWRDLGAPA